MDTHTKKENVAKRQKEAPILPSKWSLQIMSGSTFAKISDFHSQPVVASRNF